MTHARAFITLAALGVAALAPLPAAAQEWPARTVKIMVGFGAGGGTDLAARIVAQPLQEILGVPVVVENKASAGGILAGDQVAKGQKDGYTILMMSNAHAVSAAMYKALPYDPIKDFQMLSLVATAGLVMIAAPEFPAGDVKGAISVLKSDPNKFNYGSAGVGTTQQFSAELFNQMAGVPITHIPYRSTPAVLAGLLSKDVNYAFELIQIVSGQIRAGTLKAIAVTSPERHPALPEVPTAAESGLPGYDVTSWYGLAMAPGTPRPIVDKLNKAVAEALARPAVRKQISDIGAQPKTSTPEELSRHIEAEIVKWQGVREKAGIPQL
ncbi:MAG: tripartite tricarboxylate transporter substrate binding protein [Hyphomicrobiales bacterium]|nr:tripartite tricarboxylate transporter substrate binding protein [Alphaproteobacteria bacterium]